MKSPAVTTSVKACIAGLPTPLLAAIVIGKLPATVAVPASVAVPFKLSVNETPPGNGPVSIKLAVGKPIVVTLNVPVVPAVNVVVASLVIVDACRTSSVPFIGAAV